MRLVKKSTIATLWGKSRTWATHMTRSDGALFDAVYDNQVNVDSDCYRDWAAAQGFVHSRDDRLEPLAPQPGGSAIKEADDGSPGAMRSLLDVTLREVLTQFGGEGEFSLWLADIKKAEDIREKRLRNEQTEGSVISREGVKTQLLALIEELSRRLLLDGAKTITRRNYAAARADVDIEDAEKETRDNISQNLEKARSSIVRKLRKM